MYQSLVHKQTSRVVQIVEGAADVRFDVHDSYMWIDGPHEKDEKLQSSDFYYDPAEGQIKQITYKAPSYDLSRRMAYDTIANQLDMLYRDMESGIISGKEDSEWFAHVKSVKDEYPKP